jgi:hypothetical protein
MTARPRIVTNLFISFPSPVASCVPGRATGEQGYPAVIIEAALKIQALFGRDILSNALLIFDGCANLFSLAF